VAFENSPLFSGVLSEDSSALLPLLDLYLGLVVLGLLLLNFKTVYLELKGEESELPWLLWNYELFFCTSGVA
jgi:hypothetical protein